MKKKTRTKKELIEDPADVRQQPAGMKKPPSETKTSLQALQASETRYRHLFETAEDGILILNAETGEIDDVNPYMVEMLHYSHEEFMGKRLWEVSPFKDTVVNQAAFKELQDKGYIRYKDLPLQTKEGKPVAVEFVSNAYQSNGNKVIQCNIRNINERKQIDQKLQEAVIFQQRLIDALPVPVFYKDSEGRYLGCNSSFEKFFGRKKEQIAGKSVYDISSKEIADIYNEKDMALLRNPGTQIYESTVKDTGGIVHNVIFHKATFPNMDDSVGGLIGAILDITDRKQAEEALRESERQYHEFFTTSRDCVFIISAEGKWIDFNGASLEMLGYDSREELSQVPVSSLYVNTEVRHKLTAIIQKQEYVKEYPVQLKRKNGAVIDTLITLRLRRNANGFVTGYYGTIHDITERKQAEETLRVSEENYRNLFENAGEAIYVVQDGKLVFFNPMATMMIGYSAEELMSRSFIEFIHPDDRDMVIDRYARRIKGEKLAHIYPFRIIHRDGRVMWVELNAVLINWRGNPATLNFLSDITERNRAEEEHKAHIRFLESLERIDQVIKEEADVEQMLRHILQVVFSFFDCDRAWFFYPCDPDAPTFRVPMEICRSEYPGAKVLNVDVPMSPDMAQNLREALASDEPVIYIAGTEKPINKVTAKQFGVQSQMFVALYPKLGKPWVFGMHQCSYPRIWTEEEQKLFKEISRRISDGLSGVLYLRELQENEARLSEAQRLAHIGSWEWDAIADTITWSEEYYRIYGFDPTQHPPGYEEHLKAYTPESAVRLDAAVKRNMQTGEPYEVDLELANPKGLCRWITARSETLRDAQGKIIGLHGTAQDITERKQYEESLHNASLYTRSLIEASLDPLVTINPEGKITDVNKATEIITGISRGQLVGSDFTDYFTEPEKARAGYQQVLSEGLVRNYPLLIRHTSGNTIDVLYNATVYKNEAGQVQGVFAAAHDITERKRTEEVLLISEGRYRKAEAIGHVGNWEYDLQTLKFWGSDEANRIYGFDPEALDFTTDEVENCIPERERVHQALVDLIEADKPYNLEFEIHPKNSLKPRIISSVAELKRDKHGNPLLVTGVIQDITERKRAEDMLRESEEQYRLIAENTADTIAVFDLNLNPTYISPSILNHRGYTVQEAMTQTLDQILTPDSLQQASKNFADQMALESSGTADPTRTALMEFEEYCKDGSTIWVELAASFLRDNNLKPTGILTVTRDITERKQAEERLKETLSRLRKSIDTTIQVLVSAVESRDPYTAGHQSRVADIARTIATEMGLSKERIEGIRMAGSIHDIGKLSIPSEILSKPTKLSELEFSLIQEHSHRGFEILKDVESPWPLAQIVYQHHERMDGSGYPRNLKGDEILLEARIMAVSDVVESMASHRPYRAALGIDAALNEIENNKGTLYDNAVADACLRLFREKGYQLLA